MAVTASDRPGGDSHRRAWPAADCTLARRCGATRRTCTWRCSMRQRATIAVLTYASAATDAYPQRRRTASAGAAAGTRDPRPVRTASGRLARHAALARPRLLGCCASARGRGAGARARRLIAFLPVEGEGLHQIPVGPVHAGIIEPGHFRFTANGETWCGWSSGSATCTRASSADGRRDARARREARRPHLRRQHRRLCLCLCAGRRGRALQVDGAAARRLSARADGGAGAARQPFRRHRRDLQRRRLRADACAMRRPARARAARGGRLLRPPADDGRHRAGRRRARDLAAAGLGAIDDAARRDAPACSRG